MVALASSVAEGSSYAAAIFGLVGSLTSVMGPENFRRVAELIRDARYNMISEMRAELGLSSFRRGGGANPFAGTDLEEKYASASRSRPGPLALSKTGPKKPKP
jgi:hypothetical protein